MILLACPACDRQFDVTHVPRGNRVRCMCDEVITVGAQKSLQVRALHCSHCGGAVKSEDEHCAWCGAKLTEKDRKESTLCPKCFKRIEDDANHCSECGVAIAPQALTPLPEDKSCPRCKGELQIRSLGILDVVECSACGGLWLDAHVFEAVCRDAERRLESFAVVSKKAEQESVAVANQPVRYIPCLTCGEMMNRRQFRHGRESSGVILDFCREHGVWLDHLELESIVEFVRTRAGSGDARGGGLNPYPIDRGKKSPPPIPITRNARRTDSPWEVVLSVLEVVAGVLWLLR